MAITQLSLFLKNKPGVLSETLGKISAAGINIRALSIADTADFGILRMIVPDIEQAKKVIGTSAIVTETSVIAVRMADRAGALCDVLKVLDGKGINVEYIYAFTGAQSGSAYVVLRVDDCGAAETALAANGFATLSDIGLAELL